MRGTKVESQLRDLLSARLGREAFEITRTATLVEDLGVNSLDYIEFAMDAELAFDIELDAEAFPRLKTFGQFVDYIAAAIDHVASNSRHSAA